MLILFKGYFGVGKFMLLKLIVVIEKFIVGSVLVNGENVGVMKCVVVFWLCCNIG